jgi:hypothetical protein
VRRFNSTFQRTYGRALELRVRGATPTALVQLSSSARRCFDVAADPAAIALAFKSDPLLGPLVKRRPGLRIPGVWDPFECAVRALLGQQVSVAAARTFAARLRGPSSLVCEACGPHDAITMTHPPCTWVSSRLHPHGGGGVRKWRVPGQVGGVTWRGMTRRIIRRTALTSLALATIARGVQAGQASSNVAQMWQATGRLCTRFC